MADSQFLPLMREIRNLSLMVENKKLPLMTKMYNFASCFQDNNNGLRVNLSLFSFCAECVASSLVNVLIAEIGF